MDMVDDIWCGEIEATNLASCLLTTIITVDLNKTQTLSCFFWHFDTALQDLLGPSLEDLLNFCKGRLSLKTVRTLSGSAVGFSGSTRGGADRRQGARMILNKNFAGWICDVLKFGVRQNKESFFVPSRIPLSKMGPSKMGKSEEGPGKCSRWVDGPIFAKRWGADDCRSNDQSSQPQGDERNLWLSMVRRCPEK